MSEHQESLDFADECRAHSLSTPPCSASGRRPSPKQSNILAALRDKPEITLSEAVRLIGGNLYCNAENHVGVTLSNMVKRGMIERVKPGVFRLPNPKAETSDQ